MRVARRDSQSGYPVVLSFAELNNVFRDMIPQQKEFVSSPSVPQGKIVLNRFLETIQGPRH